MEQVLVKVYSNLNLGYLGMKPSELTIEEWEETLENLPCNICKKNVKVNYKIFYIKTYNKGR